MVSPVNSDKPINTTTEQSGRSQTTQKTTQATAAPNQQSEVAKAADATVEVDQARRLFDIENNRIEPSETRLNSSEEARSMLQSIVQQISASPETAARAQAAKASSPLSSILQNAPV